MTNLQIIILKFVFKWFTNRVWGRSQQPLQILGFFEPKLRILLISVANICYQISFSKRWISSAPLTTNAVFKLFPLYQLRHYPFIACLDTATQPQKGWCFVLKGAHFYARATRRAVCRFIRRKIFNTVWSKIRAHKGSTPGLYGS